MADKLSNVRPQLVHRCNDVLIENLLDDLLHAKILNTAEVEDITQRYSVRAQKCRSLIDTVIKKGNYSCNVLLLKIIEHDQMLGADLGLTAELPLPIEEQRKNDARPIPPVPLQSPLPKEEQSSRQEINRITMCSEAEFQEITTKEKERYPILEKGKRKRLALIICNVTFSDKDIKERKGANFDLDGMRELLEGLDYNVQWKTNLTAEEMRTTMKTFAANDHKDSDSTFLVFMSHGERDIIYGTDFNRTNVSGQERIPGALYVDDIFNAFNNENCPGLRDKPKMVIIQACRGHNMSHILVSDGAQQAPSIGQEDLENDAACVILKETDFICFYSTTPDTVSYRIISSGSPFIQCLIDVVKQHAHDSSIEDIFRKVQLSFKDARQMPTQDRKTLLKKFFLFPGY